MSELSARPGFLSPEAVALTRKHLVSVVRTPPHEGDIH